MPNRYWRGGSGTWNSTNTANWSTTSGGAGGASVPTAADSVFFDQAATYTVTLSGTINCLDFNVSAGTVTFSSTGTPNIAGSFSITASTVWSGTGTITFSGTAARTITTNGVTINGAITFNGVGGSWQLQGALTLPTTRTVTLTNGTLDLNNQTLTAGAFSSSNSNTRNVTFGTTGNFALGASGTYWNTSTNTNLTVTGTPTVNLNYAGSVACTLNPGTPVRDQSFNFNITAGTYTLTMATCGVRTIIFTGYSGTLDMSLNTTITVYGSFVLSSGMSFGTTSSTISWVFASNAGTRTFTTAGQNFEQHSITFNAPSTTYVLSDDFTCASISKPFKLNNGTIDLNGKTLFIRDFITGTGTKGFIFNGGTIDVAGNLTSWDNAAPTGFTTSAGSAPGTIFMSSTAAKTFVGGGSSYAATLVNGGSTSTGALTITGSNTFYDLGYTGTSPTFYFTAGTNTTFTALNIAGTSTSSRVTFNSTASSTSYTITQARGLVSCNFMNITRSTATGGAVFYAGANSINGGNNSGWILTAPPTNALDVTNFFTMFN